MSEMPGTPSKERITKDLSRFSVTTLTVIFCLITYILVFLADLREDPAIQYTDFVNSFYIAGRLVGEDQVEKLYPPSQYYTFKNAPFDRYAKEILPEAPTEPMYMFIYPPVTALLFAPFSAVTPRTALIIWQVISVAALFAACFCFSRVAKNESNVWLLFRQSFLLFTVAQVLIIGQTAFVLGLLPLCLGYYFWQKDMPFRAGLAWATLWLKPQLLVPVFMVVAALAIERLYKGRKASDDALEIGRLAAGLAVGILFLIGIALVCLGPAAFLGWLDALALLNQMFCEPGGYLWAYHVFASLPCSALLALPPAWWHAGKLLALFLSSFVFLLGMIYLIRLTHLPLEKSTRRDLLLAFAIALTPLMSTFLLLSDSVLLLAPAWIFLKRFPANSRSGELSRLAIMFFVLAVDFYLLMLLVPVVKPPAWYMVLVFLGFAEAYRRISGAVLSENAGD